ncbi:MAG: potassium/proton antiporter [Oligoflexia bacterium]|nr:potassium/proton antiporter [Oligoflexia bacterium]
MSPFEKSLIIASALVVLSVVTSKASSRLGVPALLLFLIIGIGAGAHGFGGIHLTNYALAQELGTIALTFILFSGGMDTDLKAVRPVLKPALILSTLGVLVAAFCVGIFARAALGFSLLEGTLLGATVASTDVAAVFSVLRSKNVTLNAGLGPLLELESALNDPMAVFLSVVLLGVIRSDGHSVLSLVPLFFQQIAVGALIGWISGKCIVPLINRLKLEYEGLYPVLSLAWIVLTYGIAQVSGGSGFLAVYITGIIAGNANLLFRKSLIHFHEGAAWLGQIGMFLAMGLLVDPSALLAVAPLGIALSLFLVLVARPASVLASLVGSRFNLREKLMVSWAGLRGAVPIILASYVLAAHIPRGNEIFNLVFFVTFVSVLLQGTTTPAVSKWLKVHLPFRKKHRFPIEFNPTQSVRNKLIEIAVPPGAASIGKALVELHLPQDVLIVLIQRDTDIVVPRGDTHLNEQDTLLVLSENESAEDIKKLFL